MAHTPDEVAASKSSANERRMAVISDKGAANHVVGAVEGAASRSSAYNGRMANIPDESAANHAVAAVGPDASKDSAYERRMAVIPDEGAANRPAEAVGSRGRRQDLTTSAPDDNWFALLNTTPFPSGTSTSQ